MIVVTHSDVAVRLDFVNPKALLHKGSSSTQQLLKLSQSEWPHLNKILQSSCNSVTKHTRIHI